MTAIVETTAPAAVEPVKPYIGWTVANGSTYLGDGDSHFWTTYFDAAKGEFVQHGHGYWQVNAALDAPEDVKAAWDAKIAAAKAASAAYYALQAVTDRLREEREDAARPTPGKIVKVVKGRKVAIGTIGQVQRRDEGQWGMRLWIEVEGTQERLWVSEQNVEVVSQG